MIRYGSIDTRILKCHPFMCDLLKREHEHGFVDITTTNEQGTVATFLEDCIVYLENPYTHLLKGSIGYSINSTQLTTAITHIDHRDVICCCTCTTICKMYYKFKAGDTLRVHTDGYLNPEHYVGHLSLFEDDYREGMLSISDENVYFGSLSLEKENKL